VQIYSLGDFGMGRALHDTTATSIRVDTTGETHNPNTRQTTYKTHHPILVVDDDPDACTILRLFLTAEGFEVVTAQSRLAALSCMREHLPSLIITDYNMPEATGLDLCRDLRSDPRTWAIPIILHTGCDLSHTDETLFDQVFEKPTDLNRLSYAIRRMLAARSTTAH
jgi:CheY-like chemotaxis protein